MHVQPVVLQRPLRVLPRNAVVPDRRDAPQALDRDLALLRRGVPLAMLDAFDTRYSHAHGISVFAPTVQTTLMLGWRVGLHPADTDGWELLRIER